MFYPYNAIDYQYGFVLSSVFNLKKKENIRNGNRGLLGTRLFACATDRILGLDSIQ